MPILVVGAAGYIGSHIAHALVERGESVVAVDDLSTGSSQRLGRLPLHRIDVTSAEAVGALSELMLEKQVDGVIHLAARKAVGESTREPLLYYSHNIDGVVNVAAAMAAAGVRQVVLSSTAAVYGESGEAPLTEDAPTNPINPYGRSKLVGEWVLGDSAAAYGLRAASLRYFNVAGAGDRALADRGLTNLIPLVVDAAQRGSAVEIFGDDFPTPDGTCVRDYVHVADVAAAHLAVLDRLRNAREPHRVYNIGGGAGSSVREVVDAVQLVSCRPVAFRMVSRRPGDPASVVADVSRARSELGWGPRHDLFGIVASEWAARTTNAVTRSA